MSVVSDFLGDVRVHRVAAAVAAVLLVVQAQLSQGGASFGLDANTVAQVVGSVGFFVAAAREVADPQILKFIFKGKGVPTDPSVPPAQ